MFFFYNVYELRHVRETFWSFYNNTKIEWVLKNNITKLILNEVFIEV